MALVAIIGMIADVLLEPYLRPDVRTLIIGLLALMLEVWAVQMSLKTKYRSFLIIIRNIGPVPQSHSETM